MKAVSGMIAMERLKTMLDYENHRLDEETIDAIRREIGEVVSRYVDVEPENMDIKVVLKEYKKRA